MKPMILARAALVCLLALAASPVPGEILAMVNYESKTADSLKSLKLGGPTARQEGIGILDVDPESPAFGELLWTMPLPADLVAHHLFYDRTMTKAYLTSLGKGELRVIDMRRNPYRVTKVDVPGCQLGEDVIFNEANTTWYLTCMNSGNVFVGSVATDEVQAEISVPDTYPHGLAVHTGIDRILVTSTVRGDLKDPRESLTVVKASTGEVLGEIKVSNKPTPSGEAPVEILFVPGSSPPVAYVTNMFGGTLWTATWNPKAQDFEVAQVFDFGPGGDGIALEMYFDARGTKLYVTTAKPGKLHIFDIARDAARPVLKASLPTGEGAHHVAITRDERYAFVQNALLNLPGMSDGSITVIDLQQERRVGSVDTLKKLGLNPNSIVLLPEWNSLAGH